jgi:hypothetical protein
MTGVTDSRPKHRPLGALHWYLYTEWEDPGFGPRAERVHRAFQEAETQVDGP